MTNKQAAQILRDHKRLVRGADSFTRAIDTAITALEQTEPTELERFKAAVELLFPCKNGMKYLVVDKDGTIAAFVKKPRPVVTSWRHGGSEYLTVAKVTVPDGIDWRDCLIERA